MLRVRLCLVLSDNVVTCIVVVKACCTKFVWIELVITTSFKVQNKSLMMTISIRLHVWRGKRWEISLCTWAPFYNVIAAMLFRNVSWVAMHIFRHGEHSKWIPKSLMVWTHLHHERCATIRCGTLKQICNIVRKWVEDKQNEKVLGWINN